MSEMPRSPCLSVIIVSWNVGELLLQAIDSLEATWQGPREDLEIIVVDNASTDGTPEMLRTSTQEVRLLVNRENRGFAAANNQGLTIARGQYILLLNSDTRVRPQALRRLVAYLETHPDIGLVGPRLLNEDGTIQPSRRRFPTLPILFLESTWLEGLLPRKTLALYYVEDRPDDMPQDVDWVTGAAMLVRRETVDQVGPLDEGFFMYSEELDWCRRIREAGWRIAYEPAAEVVHYGGKSSDQVVAQRHIYFQSSKVRYAYKYHGRLVASLLRVWLLGQYVAQIVIEGVKWTLGHRRPLRAQRVRAYRQVLASRLRGPRGPDRTAHKAEEARI